MTGEITAGKYFGAIPMFNGKPAKATARVKDQCKLFRLTNDVVKRLSQTVKDALLKNASNKYL